MDYFIQHLIPVAIESPEVLVKAVVNVSHLVATHFLSKCLLRLLVGKTGAGGRGLVSQWDVEPQCG